MFSECALWNWKSARDIWEVARYNIINVPFGAQIHDPLWFFRLIEQESRKKRAVESWPILRKYNLFCVQCSHYLDQETKKLFAFVHGMSIALMEKLEPFLFDIHSNLAIVNLVIIKNNNNWAKTEWELSKPEQKLSNSWVKAVQTWGTTEQKWAKTE